MIGEQEGGALQDNWDRVLGGVYFEYYSDLVRFWLLPST
jgi:hypothetical protein